MKENDVQLIHSVLSGDDGAFNVLVGKYRKSVHALAWRKVGIFTLLKRLRKTLSFRYTKNFQRSGIPISLLGWLYVIADRLCKNWRRKNKPAAMQALENMNPSEIDEFSYRCYELKQREREASEHRHEIVQGLLKKLPESERTVVVLYYLSEMTVKEIGDFLSVSVNTIKSRLRRARKRLQVYKKELTTSDPAVSLTYLLT